MTLSSLWMSAQTIVADSTHKEKIAEKLTALSHMSGEEVISMIIRGALDISARILIALVILAIGRWIIRYLKNILRKMLTKREVDASLKSFLMSLVSISLTLFLIITIISILGIDTTSFVAIFASAGLAIGMALSGTLQNFAGGVMILIFKPFHVGDFIEAQGQTGTVKEIQLFNTIINTPDNKTIMIPNGGISTGIINNYSKENRRRVEWTFGIGYGDEGREGEFEARWPMQYHFVGKDITRFHCVIWPAMLMAAGLPVAHTVFGHGFLLTKGEKMSKSKGNGMKPADLVKIFGVDAYRYYFMSDVQFGHDGNISMERMVQVYNADLANTWGNLCSRVFNMTKKYFDGKVPEVPADAAARVANPMLPIAEGLYAKYDACLGQVDFTGAAAAVQELAGRVNLYVEESAPWNLAKKEETAGDLAAVIYNSLEAIRIIALYMAPFMPNTSAEVFSRLGLGEIAACTDIEAATKWGQLPAGNAVTVGDPLFPRLNMDEIDLDAE